MSLAPLRMSVPASDGLILKGELSYPAGATDRAAPLAILAHQYPSTRDSFAPLAADLLAAGIAVLAFDQRGHGESIVSPRGPVIVDAPEGAANVAAWSKGLGHTSSRLVPGSGHAMAIYFDVRDELVRFLREGLDAG